MITPELKDQLLNFLVRNGPEYSFDRGSSDYIIPSWDYLEMILEQLERRGFVKLTYTKMSLSTKLTADAYDFQYHGGFVALEAIFMDNLKKLELELDKLQRSVPEKVATFTAILGGISTYLGLFSHPH